jgi:hypothetical protein
MRLTPDRNLKLFFGANRPQSVVDLCTNQLSGKQMILTNFKFACHLKRDILKEPI